MERKRESTFIHGEAQRKQTAKLNSLVENNVKSLQHENEMFSHVDPDRYWGNGKGFLYH